MYVRSAGCYRCQEPTNLAGCAGEVSGASLIFYFLTRTDWDEPPRIRHQLAKMLLRQGHEVIFFERPRKSGSFPPHQPQLGLTCVRVTEALHHQLRPVALLQRLSGWCARQRIEAAIEKYSLPRPDVVVNFNYDYEFAKELFPESRLILFLNDDFVGMARSWMRHEAERVEAACARDADVVLTVSSGIASRYEGVAGVETELFLPWAESSYEAPAKAVARNTVLYFGYINSRNDWPLIRELVESSSMNFRFVGDAGDRVSAESMRALSTRSNVEHLGAMAFEKVSLDDVCCSIAPYDMSVEGAAAITLNNRSLRLLSRGIPSVITEMPHLLPSACRVVRPATDAAGFQEAIEDFHREFFEIQGEIEAFVEENGEAARYRRLIELSTARSD